MKNEPRKPRIFTKSCLGDPIKEITQHDSDFKLRASNPLEFQKVFSCSLVRQSKRIASNTDRWPQNSQN